MAIINYTQDEMQDARQSQVSFSLIPKGIYDGWIEAIEDRVSKSGTPSVDLKVNVNVDGKDRKVFDAWYLESEKARHIGLARMSELMSILGVADNGTVDTAKFVGMDVKVRVGVKKGIDGQERNCVNEYISPNGNERGKGVGPDSFDDSDAPF